MQYRTVCANCGREYMVDGTPGETIRAICPYCGAKANVVTPATDEALAVGEIQKPMMKRRKTEKPFFWKVILWSLIIVTVVFVVFAVLYLVFTTLSK